MMRYLFCGLLIIFTAVNSAAQSPGNKTILFIGAHPDDETAISEVLSKYSRLGNKVLVMIATDGRDGTRVTNIPAGDSLAKLRKLESICGCKKLGIQPPIYLSIERLDTKIGVRKYFNCHQQLLDSLKVKIPAIQPDVIITFGPDGDTHHSEHIVVGATVTELLLAEGWVEKYPLYYAAWKKDSTDVEALGYVDEQYLNVKIEYEQQDRRKAVEAIACFVTQYTAAEIEEEINKKLKETTNMLYFRRFAVAKGLKNDF